MRVEVDRRRASLLRPGRGRLAACALLVIAGMASCAREARQASTEAPLEPNERVADAASAGPLSPPTLADSAPRDYPGVHNVVAFHEGFFSGSVPEGEAGFATLRAWGITTILSVDGAVPDVERARAWGMRYIHLPIGYDGFDDSRALQLARATRDALDTGRVYIHCHHGKHRSAGAAATIVANLGWNSPERMVARMKISGTAPGYTGLYECAANAVALEPEVVDSVTADFPEISRPTDFVQGMVELDEALEHLGEIEAAGWVSPADHPDLVPAAEAGHLVDVLRYLHEEQRAAGEPPGFREGLRANEDLARRLEDLLAFRRTDSRPAGAEAAALSIQFSLVRTSCRDCHVRYRD